MNMKAKISVNTVAAVVGLVLCTSMLSIAQAATIDLFAGGENRGSYNTPELLPSDNWKITGGGYQLRSIYADPTFTGTGATVAVAGASSYHLFDIPALAAGEFFDSVSFSVWHPANSFVTVGFDFPNGASETARLWSIDSTDFNVLRTPAGDAGLQGQGIAVLAAINTDLSTGTEYGSITVTAAQNSTSQTISLNADALAALNLIGQSGGGEWGFGMAMDLDLGYTLPAGEFFGYKRILRGSSFANPDGQLTMSVVPVPAAVWLFGSGLIGLVAIARRRQQNAI